MFLFFNGPFEGSVLALVTFEAGIKEVFVLPHLSSEKMCSDKETVLRV